MIRGVNWNRLDWTRPNSELAERLGVSVSAVREHRKAGGYPAPRFRRGSRAKVAFWSAVDWDRTDTELALALGESNSVVNYWRVKLGHPSPRKWKRLQESVNAGRRSWDWSLRDLDLSRIHGLSRERVRQIRRFLGLPKSPGHRRRIPSRAHERRR